jgi:hypothetical protein
MPGKIKILSLVLLSFVLLTGFSSPMQPPKNLLKSSIANLTTSNRDWKATGEATIEKFDGLLCYVVRNGGTFSQVATFPSDPVEQYIVLIGRGSAERINPNGSTLDLPVIYGQVLGEEQGKERILTYALGTTMVVRGPANEWVKMAGIFQLHEGVKGLRFFLGQGEPKGVVHNGSAARFDDLGLYVFSTEREAQLFVRNY